MTTTLWSLGLALFAAMAGAFAVFFLKRAAERFSFNPLRMLTNKHLYYGGIFFAIGTLLFVIALKGGDLSALYPVSSTSYIWAGFMSHEYLGEKITKKTWWGIAFIIIGVSLIGFGS